MTSRQDVYAAIDSERDYQTRVWRENAGLEPTAPVRTVAVRRRPGPARR